MVFFDDPNAIDYIKRAKRREIFRTELGGEDVEPPQSREDFFHDREDLSMASLRKEFIHLKRKNNRRDCYSLIKEERTRNPFMKNIAKSSEFSPSMGVVHRDRANNPNSNFCSGGLFKSPHENRMSRKDFELR